MVKAARKTAFKGPSVTLSKHLCFTQLFLSDSVSSHFSLCFFSSSCKVAIEPIQIFLWMSLEHLQVCVYADTLRLYQQYLRISGDDVRVIIDEGLELIPSSEQSLGSCSLTNQSDHGSVRISLMWRKPEIAAAAAAAASSSPGWPVFMGMLTLINHHTRIIPAFQLIHRQLKTLAARYIYGWPHVYQLGL